MLLVLKNLLQRFFTKALKLAGATTSNSLMIGDSYAADIMGAHSVGLPTIWFHTSDEVIPSQQVTVHHLLDILDYLEL